MPNHCHNDLYIEGSARQVAAILSLVGADKEAPEFNFNKILPYPENFAERDREFAALGWKAAEEKYGAGAKDGYNSGGYEWCTENWGTKWNAYEVARRDYFGVCITFQTAWCPPLAVIAALHVMFPDCGFTLEFFERGAEFSGGVRFDAKSEYDEDDSWAPGVPGDKWEGRYSGTRGG
ncbi:MAG TPA: hypothetical protein VGC21_10210 [Telluria sp.]|jgi:hypothetical protein